MERFRDREISKERTYAAKRSMKICDVNVDNIGISKIVKKNNSKYLIGYLDKTIRPLVLIMPKISGYVETFKVKDGNNKINVFPCRWSKAIREV